MKLFADYHTHTVHSHGKGTIRENALAAKEKGLSALGIADHGPASIGLGVKGEKGFAKIKEEIAALNRENSGVNVLFSVEANVIGVNGTIDVPKKLQRSMDMVLAGLHPLVWPASLRDGFDLFVQNRLARLSGRFRRRARLTNTKAIVEAVYKNDIDIVTHPGLKLDIDTAELARACAKRDTAMEINAGHGYMTVEYVKIAMREGAKFAIGSDAHQPADVGRLEPGIAVAEKAGVPAERIINAWKE